MVAYESPVSYKLIYVFSVPYEDHAGLLKIGDATIKTSASAAQLPPNCDMLNAAARERIKQETKTAMTQYELLYTEIAEKIVRLDDGSTKAVAFRDYEVNEVLARSGYPARKFFDTGKASEWYPVALQTAKNAIKAVKEGRNVLTEAEKTEAERTDSPLADAAPRPVIVLRDEQKDAVTRTRSIFKKQDEMLWDCKMRFGKTITACSLAKECDFQKTIVVTHRPVVADGWAKDYHLVFGDSDDHIFQTKIRGGQEVDFDEHIDAENAHALRNLAASGKHFMYFASMQDLRESARVKPGGYKKNDVVFDMDWDFIIFDEAHEGTQTELGQKVEQLLVAPKHGKAPKVLSLSGTPYNIIGKYEDNVYSWDYVMEQRRKRMWDSLYPGVPNPYADLPELRILTFDLRDNMPDSYRYETEDMAFNFREFFRTWTGDPKQDHRPLPPGAQIGRFVHESDVKGFLDLITTDSENSFYPFSSHEYRQMFKHTFWMVPGVKAAAALSDLLRHHPVFMHYKVANVAGEGDEEKAYDDALKEVRAAIQENPYTITISCGRLTTGVTVPEWTAVMMLTGSANTAAAGYMQTIFRVQSAGSIDGKQKEICYAFDFAPDRAIKVLSEVHSIGKKSKRDDSAAMVALGDFLNFCPVLSVDGTGMHEYNVPRLMRQIKRLTVDKAIKSGFDDESVYKSDTGIVMDEADVALFHKLGGILTGQKQAKTPKKVKINEQGLTGEEYAVVEKARNKPKRQRTPEEEALLEKEKQQRKEREKVIQLLRNISIRLPLLIYGADVDLTESIHMRDFITLVDDESWKEFMPKDVTKDLFRQLLKYYDEDVIVGAGLRIRRMARAADELPPTQRVLRIAEIFSLFRNPDKETVLTPWRVVNMHLSDMLGGFCFYDETFQHPDGLLDEPRLIDRGDASEAVLLNPDARILEMNSKSGLYPLYMAYSIYAMKLTGREDQMPLDETQRLWQETVEQNIFVLCKTKMARLITMRTLVGYQGWPVNAIYLTKLMERMQDMKRLSNKLRNPETWGKEGEKMNFDAVVGNPPYQEITGGGSELSVAATQAKPVFQMFVEQAKAVAPNYISMIIPARWYAGGIGLNEFREKMLSDRHLLRLVDFSNSKDCFPTVDIAGGLCYFLWSRETDADCIVTNRIGVEENTVTRRLDEFEGLFIRSNEAIPIIHKVRKKASHFMDESVFPIDAFSFPSKARGEALPFENCVSLIHSQGVGYVRRDEVKKNAELIDKYKVTIGILVPSNGEVGIDPAKGFKSITFPRILLPNEVTTFSYLVLYTADTEEEANNFSYFITRKFPRFMMRVTYSSMHISRNNFLFVPKMDFHRKWTDRELYDYFGLTENEILLIEKTMRPMDNPTSD